MESFNLALLSTPVVMKDMSSDIQELPQKSSKKEFSGVLAQEENRSGTVKNDVVVDQKKPRKAQVERKADASPKAGSSAKHKPLKNESSDDTSANDDSQETGTNVLVTAPIEDTAEEVAAKVKRANDFADNLELQALLAEQSEEGGVLPTVQIETSELPGVKSSDVSELSEALVAQNILLVQNSEDNINNEDGLPALNLSVGKESGGEAASQVCEVAVKDEPAVELFPVETKPETEVKKVSEKLPTPGTEIEVVAAPAKEKRDPAESHKIENHEGGKHKVEKPKVGKQKVENAKIVTVQNTVSDVSDAAAVSVEPVVSKAEKDSLHQTRAAAHLSSHSGISLDELSGEMEVQVESEIVVSDEKMQRKANFSGRLADNRFLSTNQAGTVHLQGRARENQTSLMQNGQGQKDATVFAEGENRRGKAIFTDELKSSVSEKITLESVLQGGTKDKSGGLETSFNKSVLLTDVGSDLDKTVAIKKGSAALTAKPLPISDEHLLNQIQAGLTRPVNGRQTVTIKLWPEHLGRVDVKLVMNKQHLTATFMVDHPDVKDAMMRKVDSLRDSLGLRGIDAKDISIKVTPAKSGDGPSLMTDNQQQNGNSAWRQFNQGNFANNNSGSQSGWDDNFNTESLQVGTDVIENISSLTGDALDAGSLHITA